MYRNILVIDDEYEKFAILLSENIKDIARNSHLPFDFDFVFKSSPEDAKNYLLEKPSIDLIILDLIFDIDSKPSRGGFGLLRYIKEYHSDIPVLMFSSTDKFDDLYQAAFSEASHPDHFIKKSETINKKSANGGLDRDFQKIYDKVVNLLNKYGKIPVKNGILITHGTDTMAWAFSILRYGLNDLKTNIVLTGSQLPLEGTFSPSDAIGNMLTSVKILNYLEPPNIVQVFNDGLHIFNKNLNKIKKWSFDAFTGDEFGRIEYEDLKINDEDSYKLTKNNKLDKLYFIRTGGTIDSSKSQDGLVANADFTTKYLRALGNEYFNEPPDVININPKDSSLFNPIDWITMIKKIEEIGFAKADDQFDWNILLINPSPFMKNDYYETLAELVINKYSGAIVLGYGAGNLNIFGSDKVPLVVKENNDFKEKYGESEFIKQYDYSFIPFLRKMERYNKNNPDNYKYIIMNSQVPLDLYDIEYQAGTIPIYYGTVPSGDLSYPEAQTKLAYILGHMDLIRSESINNDLSIEQLTKACFLSGIRFTKKSNKLKFLDISEVNCNCKLYIHKNNVFVKDNFENALTSIVKLFSNS